MACHHVQMWSLSGLVAAFLDLAIAYLLLCASALAYFVSRFMGFFRLSLPCTCDGIFYSNRSNRFCLNRLLVDFPTVKVADVQLSVKQRFPFSNSIYGLNHDRGIGADNNDNNHGNEFLGVEYEASSSSLSDERRSADFRGKMSSWPEKYDMKGKRAVRPRSRLSLRRSGVRPLGKYPPVSSRDPSPLLEPSRFGTNWGKDGLTSKPASSCTELRYIEYNEKASADEAATIVSASRSPVDFTCIKQNIKSSEEQQDTPRGIRSSRGDEKNTVRILEQELEEERSARAALYSDLEKERSAAASAAEEALAMILRLQEEKAAINMEARQNQRLIEEKYAYDTEEINILKEILVRREKEKHVLEKEVEAYRQVVSVEDKRLTNDSPDKNNARRLACLPFDPNDNPILLLQQLAASTDKKDGRFDGKRQGDMDEQSEQISVCNSVGSLDLQEKEIVSVDNCFQSKSKDPRENAISPDAREVQQTEEISIGCVLGEKIIETCYGNSFSSPNFKQGETSNHLLDEDSHNNDVPDVTSRSSGINEDEFNQQFSSASPELHNSSSSVLEAFVEKGVDYETDTPSNNFPKVEVGGKRSGSEIAHVLPPIGPRGLPSLSVSRRLSQTALDNEMLKIGSEVGQLQERLKLVQKGKEKLVPHTETQTLHPFGDTRSRENIQLKLLEGIARQVQEIRHPSEPGAARQHSLPLPTSKVDSKKRRSRSFSSGFQRSSEG